MALPSAAPARPLPILAYHNIGSPPDGAAHRGMYLARDRFEGHLGTLARLGWRGVSMDQALPALRGGAHQRVAAITFDDGYFDTLQALPALLRHGFTATCYVVADRIGRHNTWDSALLGVRKPLMDAAAVGTWLGAGMHIGSHTLSHPHLPLLDRRAQRREIADSRARLQDRFGIAVDHFCYPYGDHDAACVEAVAEAGYATAVTSEQGRVRRGDALLALPRVLTSGESNRHAFAARALLWGLRRR